MDELLAEDQDPRESVGASGHQPPRRTDADRLAAERTALRRVATLVAARAEPSEVFDAATEALGRCIRAAKAGLWRFEPSGEITTVAAATGPAKLITWPVGSQQAVAGSHLVAKVQNTGRSVRVDSYDTVSASVATRVGQDGIFSAVAVPVMVDGRVWGMAAAGSVRPGPMPADTEACIAGFADLIAAAVSYTDFDEQERRLDTASPRSVLMDSLLEGRTVDRWRLWEAANQLRLPNQGPFVVVAADVPAVGRIPLPEIEPKLRSLDVYSSWRMLPDLLVGIVHVKSDRQLDTILALLSRMATRRVGVSHRFDDLRDVPQAFHVAKVTVRSSVRGGSLVAIFDGSILSTAAVSAPAVMVKSVAALLGAFDDLGDEERELLYETFRVWQDSEASVRATAEVLVCHPNTVRYRLRRIEQRTGRSLSRPKDVAELCLAFEVQRRLM